MYFRALKIICERCVHGPALQKLLRNVSSTEEEVRSRALVALKFLVNSRMALRPIFPSLANLLSASERKLNTLDMHLALVSSLVNSLPPQDADITLPYERNAVENNAVA